MSWKSSQLDIQYSPDGLDSPDCPDGLGSPDCPDSPDSITIMAYHPGALIAFQELFLMDNSNLI